MARSFDGVNDSAQTGTVALAAVARVTVSLWLNASAFGVEKMIFESSNNYNNNRGGVLFISMSSSRLDLSLTSGAIGSGQYNGVRFTPPSTGAWHHYLILIDRDAGAQQFTTVYVDGASVTLTQNDTAAASGTLGDYVWNVASRNGAELFGGGVMAEFAIWSDALLTAPEAASLAAGVPAFLVRPESLLHYWPMRGKNSPEQDVAGANGMTVSGATAADHARAFGPPRRRTFAEDAGGGGAFTLPCDPGSYSLAGADASLEFGHKIAADPGSYALSGVAASPERGYPTPAAPGSYALTGTAASLGHGREVAAAPGAYAAAGTAASLEFGHEAAADPGSYAITGAAASLEYGREVAAAPGSYALTGADAALIGPGAKVLAAETGVYSLSGVAASLEWGHEAAAVPGSYSLLGTAAPLERGYPLVAVAGSYGLSGVAAGLEYVRTLTAAAGSYSLSGVAATLTYSGTPVPSPDYPFQPRTIAFGVATSSVVEFGQATSRQVEFGTET